MAGEAIVEIVDGPTAEITGIDPAEPVCEEDPITLYLEIFATEEFELTIAEAAPGIPLELITITNADLEGAGPVYTYTLIPGNGEISWTDMPPLVFTYTIESFSDDSGCPASFSGEVSVEIFKIPETGPQYHIPNTFGN